MPDPNDQFARLRSWGQAMAPGLYRDQALYLQLLRDQLPATVRTVVTTLLTADHGARIDVLSASARQSLQERIDQLVRRCSSLLTVEQLMQLARQIEREQLVRRLQAQRALLEDRSTEEASALASSPENNSEPEVPSIALSLAPPIERPELLHGLLPPGAMASEGAAASEQPSSPVSSEAADAESDDLSTLRSLFLMAGQVMATSQAATDDVHPSETDGSDQDETVVSAGDDRLLPSLPLDLLHWLDGLDLALMRRLRNLSHAINVDLMRAGLVHSLLPISLLDAVLSGQLETLPSPANLLRLRVPMPASPPEHWVDLTGILLRPADMEFDHVALRRGRSRLRHRRRQLLTMVRQQRHWQRRATTRQVQQQWWPSPPTPSPDQS